MEHLYEKLIDHAGSPIYPYHMPGHKRRAFGAMPPEAYAMDVTEIDGFDDLHCPEGILKDLQERVARLYGAEESYCLVGGSTSGILSALSAALPEGGHLLMARNCHKSAYHAAYLRNLTCTYLMPPLVRDFGICDGIRPGQVQTALEQDPEIQAVLIVSPTYEGRISQVREIAEIVHSFDKILIVDEAHGAHLGLPGAAETGIAENSCQAGADLVIHSTHKTLPAMTQTALLHVNGKRVDRERLRRFLRIYQSSSPSYVLMASIDNAITMMEQGGIDAYKKFTAAFSGLLRDLEGCRHLQFLPQDGSNWRRSDVGKLVIHAGDGGVTGQQTYDVLRKRYGLQLEMASGEYCLAMFTVADGPEGYRRMREALLELDQRVGERKERHVAEGENLLNKQNSEIGKNELLNKQAMPVIERTLGEAWDAPYEEVPLPECEGRIAAEFVNLYPPGTPIVVPGEVFTKEIRDALISYRAQGLRLRGISEPDETVRCIKK